MLNMYKTVEYITVYTVKQTKQIFFFFCKAFSIKILNSQQNEMIQFTDRRRVRENQSR